MKKNIFPVFLVLIMLPIFIAFLPVPIELHKQNKLTADSDIQFETKGWEHALSEAKKQNKLVFLDAYTSWCGPCKLLKKTTFADKAVGDFFNKSFINITVDMEKGDGVALAKKYEVNAYPTLLLLDSEENVVTYTKGYLSSEQLIEFGKYGLANQIKK
jgi:thioredoxin 1